MYFLYLTTSLDFSVYRHKVLSVIYLHINIHCMIFVYNAEKALAGNLDTDQQLLEASKSGDLEVVKVCIVWVCILKVNVLSTLQAQQGVCFFFQHTTNVRCHL